MGAFPSPSRLAACALAALAFAFASPSAAQAWPDLARAPEVHGSGALDAALVVAIEDYLFVPKVGGARRNGVEWYTFFVDGLKIPVERVAILRDAAATREAILRHAAQVAKGMPSGGTLWVVFIGHGAPAEDGGEGVLVGVDAQQSAEGLYARSVRQSELRRALGDAKTVAILDACFSGRASGGAPIAPGLQPLLLTRRVAERGVLLTAGRNDEFAGPLPGGDRPAFSYLVLGALRGWGDANGDGVVTAREAVDYARKVLTVLPVGRVQTPELASGDATTPLTVGARESAPALAAREATMRETGPRGSGGASGGFVPSAPRAVVIGPAEGAPSHKRALRGPAMVELPGGLVSLGGRAP
jgi:hypothetical protein